jgi:hypothetical protein
MFVCSQIDYRIDFASKIDSNLKLEIGAFDSIIDFSLKLLFCKVT